MEYKMLKIPKETWDRLNQFKEQNRCWPGVTSLHNGVSVLLDLEQSARDQGGTIKFFRETRPNYYRDYSQDEPVQGRLEFLNGIIKPEGEEESKS
jgi:hypothetical protein